MPPLQIVTSHGSAVPSPASAESEQLWLFGGGAGGGIDLALLRKERAALAAATRAAGTVKAYKFDLLDFTGWCKRAGRPPLPCTSDTLQLYLVGLAQLGRAYATIARRAAAVAAMHAEVGHRSPVDHDVREVLAGIGRRVGTAPRRQVAPITPGDLVRLVNACPPGPLGARDRALLLVGFASSWRRSELAALQLADVVEVRQGLVLHQRRSKVDQMGVGSDVGIHAGSRVATCPRIAWRAWVAERGRWDGPAFCFVSPVTGLIAHRAMTGDNIALAIKAACARAGLDPTKYAGHSLRAGMATAAAESGASDRAIQSRTGHKSSAMVGRYIRSGALFNVDPLAGVL